MTATASTSRLDPVKAQSFYSFMVNIPDDEAYSFTPPGTYGHIFISVTSNTGHGVAWYRSSSCASIASGSDFATANTLLAGTTGTDGKLTLGSASGVLYIENRLGSALDVVVTVITFNGVVD